MQRTMVAGLMAVIFGLFSMPASQAAPAEGSGLGSALKAVSPLTKVYWRGRRNRCAWVHYRRSRTRWYCWW